MHKKKITALLLSMGVFSTFLVSPSAFANPVVALSVNGVTITTANVASTPAVVSVPSDHRIEAVDALKFSLSGIVAGTTVSVTAQNAFIVSSLNSLLTPVTSTSGTTSASFNVGTGTTAEFFAYTKSSGLGTITVTNSGSSFTYYIRGTAGPAYNLAFTPIATASSSTIVKYTAKVTDVFGNAVAGVTPALSIINLNSTLPTSTNADGISEFTVTYPSNPGKSALSLSIAALDVPGLPVAVKQISSFIDVVDANAALIAEKAARAADKVAADAALAAEKAGRAADKAGSDAALAAEKAGRAADKAAADKNVFDLSARVAALTKQVAQIKALYNKLAIRFKQKTIK